MSILPDWRSSSAGLDPLKDPQASRTFLSCRSPISAHKESVRVGVGVGGCGGGGGDGGGGGIVFYTGLFFAIIIINAYK